MKGLPEVLMTGLMVIAGARAQDPAKPVLKAGVSVQMPVAGHATQMRDADELDAVVVAVTAEGKVYHGVQRTEPEALAKLDASRVYVKADARAPFERVLAVLDALQGRSVALLAAPPANAQKAGILPPYGIRMSVWK